tara:strand:+ start:14903 stop:15787 length:885 start_codon:yes stop_codon:yes gene_type:complete
MKDKIVGFIGLGAIGLPIAANLIKAGYHLQVHTKSREAESDKRLNGSVSSVNPKEAANRCSFLFICVSDDEAVHDVLFGENGAEEGLKEGSFIIDLSTISPAKSRSLAKKFSEKNIYYIDAPVTGGTEGAKNASLTMFLGCDNKTLTCLFPLLKIISSNIYAFGSAGKGQEVKAINQVLIAGTYASVAEAISLGQYLDLDMEKVVKALKTGAASSWVLDNRSNSMIADRYPLGFKLGLHHKDLSIAIELAQNLGLELPLTSIVKDIERKLILEGYSELDLSVLKRSFIKRNFVE